MRSSSRWRRRRTGGRKSNSACQHCERFMRTLAEQVGRLEARVRAQVKHIEQLEAENDTLRRKVDELTHQAGLARLAPNDLHLSTTSRKLLMLLLTREIVPQSAIEAHLYKGDAR